MHDADRLRFTWGLLSRRRRIHPPTTAMDSACDPPNSISGTNNGRSVDRMKSVACRPRVLLTVAEMFRLDLNPLPFDFETTTTCPTQTFKRTIPEFFLLLMRCRGAIHSTYDAHTYPRDSSVERAQPASPRFVAGMASWSAPSTTPLPFSITIVTVVIGGCYFFVLRILLCLPSPTPLTI